MPVYIIATGLTLVLCWWLYPRKHEDNEAISPEAQRILHRKRTISCIVSMLPLLTVMAVRWNVGVDTWHTYTPDYLAMKSEYTPLTETEEEIFLNSVRVKLRLYGYSKEAAQQYTLESAYKEHRTTYHHTGIGFQLLERILVFFHADVQWLYITTALLIMGFTFAAIWQQTEKPLLPCLFFVITANFFLAMNIVAQYIAVSMCMLACTFAQKRKPVWFLLLVGLAATFHLSALVFLPVYFLPKIRIRPIWCISAIAACFLIGQFALPWIPKIVETIAPKYAHHFNFESSEFEWIFFGIGCAVLALGVYYYPKAKELPYFRLWFYMNVIGLMALAFSGHVPLMKRVNYYFAAPHFLLIPMLLDLEDRKGWRTALHAVTIGLFSAMIAVSIWKMNKHATLPYQAFFQKDRVEVLKEYMEHIPGLW